ncbi:class I SAM-dependent methyltransferase [Embleya sp. MST-111070]|uniref:class I SAM-dependent methyltransferase n=1 Tax=Embleya sp. MST-111070 TaxID=3398231 RepID=UPI003F733F2D
MSPTSDHGRVRRSYDVVAEEYRERIGDELAHKPLDRALLSALIEQSDPDVPIADVGCGPGHITGWLAERGVRAVGIDLSPAMVAIAEREHPKAQFREGDFLRLPARDGEFGAAIAFYSIIHLDAGELRPAFVELHRVLRPGAQLLLAFHLGVEVRHLAEWWGREVDVDFHYLEIEAVVEQLTATGFTLEARLERSHYPQEAETRRGYLLARRTA